MSGENAPAPASPAPAAPAAPVPAPVASTPPAATPPVEVTPPAAPAEAPKPAEAAKPGEAPKPAEAAKPAVPETYEFKPPEGVTFNPQITEKASAFGKKHGLSQEAMNELVGVGGDISMAIAEANKTALSTYREQWTTQSKSDKEFGGEGFDANLALANNVFSTFGTPELKQLLVDSGLSQHPELIRWAYRVGKEFSPDRFVPGGKPSGGGASKDLASRLYPNHGKAA